MNFVWLACKVDLHSEVNILPFILRKLKKKKKGVGKGRGEGLFFKGKVGYLV